MATETAQNMMQMHKQQFLVSTNITGRIGLVFGYHIAS
jgi:hypothetical protein